jgi:hypothetical protein
MAHEDDLREDAKQAIRDVGRLHEELVGFAELKALEPALQDWQMPLAGDLEEFRRRVEQLLNRIGRLLQEISSTEFKRAGEGMAFPLATLANQLNAELDWQHGILEHIDAMLRDSARTLPEALTAKITGPVRTALQKIKAYLTPLLKRFLAKLWQIISGLLTPKEWKLQGKVGTGILGLADVGIEITFGP